jgi:hypothetical protein
MEMSLVGSWWRPTRKGEEEVGGTLLIDEDGSRLSLSGSFATWTPKQLRDGVGFPLSQPVLEPVLHGYAGGKRLTLLDAECRFPRPPGALGEERWTVDAVIHGHIHTSEHPVPFSGLEVALQHLGVWAGARSVEQKFYFGEKRRIEIAADVHQLAVAELPDAAVSIEQALAFGDSAEDGFLIRQPVVLRIEPHRPASWKDLLNDWLQPIEAFLWLATTTTSRVDRVSVRFTDSDAPTGTDWGELHVPLLQPNAAERERTLSRYELLFHLDEVPGGFEQSLVRWFRIWTDLRHVIGPLFARARAPFAYANDRFYTAAAAVEAYHRYCKESNAELPRKEHRQRVRRLEAIVDLFATDLTQWAVNAATSFNRIPMWRRIVEMLDCLGTLSAEMVEANGEGFAREVEKARHGHAHALGERGALSSESAWLYQASNALVWILRAAWLVDLGFDINWTINRITSHHTFQWTARDVRAMLSEMAERR